MNNILLTDEVSPIRTQISKPLRLSRCRTSPPGRREIGDGRQRFMRISIRGWRVGVPGSLTSGGTHAAREAWRQPDSRNRRMPRGGDEADLGVATPGWSTGNSENTVEGGGCGIASYIRCLRPRVVCSLRITMTPTGSLGGDVCLTGSGPGSRPTQQDGHARTGETPIPERLYNYFLLHLRLAFNRRGSSIIFPSNGIARCRRSARMRSQMINGRARPSLRRLIGPNSATRASIGDG